MNKRVITIGVVLVIIGIMAFRLINNKKQIESKKQVSTTSDTKVSVTVYPVQLRTGEINHAMVGTLAAHQEAEIKSEVQGQVEGIYFELGDFVKTGKTLARVDDKIRSLARQNAEQKLADAKQNLQRYKNLHEGGAATKAQLDQYQLAYNNAEIQLEQTIKELSNTTISAPFSGYITTRNIEKGSFVNIGTAIATLVDISKLKVQLSVPEREAYTLKVGDEVAITSNVYPGIKFNGKIKFISPRGDAAHNYPVEISIENQDKNPLKAGTYVDVAFSRKAKEENLQIPREALVGSLKSAQVYVVDSNNVAKLRSITVSGDYGDYLVISDGLKSGEKVVLSGQINLVDGSEVNVIK